MNMQASDITALVDEVSTPDVSAEAQETAARISALLRHLFLYDRGNVLRVIEESGLSMTQSKALLELGGLGEATEARQVERAGRGVRRLGSLDEPGRRRPGQEAARHAGSRIPSDRRVRRVAITAKGKKLVDTLVVVRQAGMETFAASLTAAQRRKLDAAVDSLMDRDDIAEAYRTPEGGRTSLTRYSHLITDDNRKWWTLGAMCFALFMIMLDNTVVNVALPSIQKDLGASISGLEWTINGYTLSFAVLLATGGRLGDIFGRRRMFLFGVVIFALSSATAGLAADADLAGCQPRRPGRRRGADDAGDALDHHRRLPRLRARQGDGDVGRRLGPRPRGRPGARRLPDRARQLAGDLLPQHPGRDRRRDRLALRGARVARQHRRPRGRLRRRRRC